MFAIENRLLSIIKLYESHSNSKEKNHNVSIRPFYNLKEQFRMVQHTNVNFTPNLDVRKIYKNITC